MYALPPAVLGTNQTPAPAAPATQTTTTVAPAIVQTVSIDHTPSRTDLLADTEQWTWAEFRDYVVAEIINRFGPFPRDARKEYGIFNRFFSQYGQDAIAIAKYAFESCDGWWGKAPISINRFCKSSDPYFSEPILERLRDIGAA